MVFRKRRFVRRKKRHTRRLRKAPMYKRISNNATNGSTVFKIVLMRKVLPIPDAVGTTKMYEYINLYKDNSQYANWSNIIQLYDLYKVLGTKIEWFPNYAAGSIPNNTVGGAQTYASGQPTMVSAVDRDSAPIITSMTALSSMQANKVVSMNRRYKRYVSNPKTGPVSSWINTSVSSPVSGDPSTIMFNGVHALVALFLSYDAGTVIGTVKYTRYIKVRGYLFNQSAGTYDPTNEDNIGNTGPTGPTGPIYG